jgi:uncharacterized membrane protein YeaQ/YmgE (transglycosylase-associated protein family)
MKKSLRYAAPIFFLVTFAAARTTTLCQQLHRKKKVIQNTARKRLVLPLLIALVILLAPCIVCNTLHAQSAATNPPMGDLERPIHACEQQVIGWKHEEQAEITLFVVAIVFGLIISALQGTDKKWAKVTTIILGIVTAGVASVNPRVFTADDRTLKRAVFEGEGIIGRLWVMVDTLKDEHLTAQDKLSIKGEYLKELLEFQAIGERLNGTMTGNAKPSNAGLELLPKVYAQAGNSVPAWTQKVPSDNTSLYFVGTAHDRSFTSAKQTSLNDAYHSAVLALKAQAPGASDASLLTLIKASAVIQDVTFAYDPSTGNYTQYTLIRLSKEIQGIGIKALSSASAVNSHPALTRFEAKDWRPGDLAFNSSSGMFVLDINGQISRIAADQQGFPHIEKLFSLDSGYVGYSLAADAQAVFVASIAPAGCTVYRYSLATKVVSRRVLAVRQRCVGIASDGSKLYLTLPGLEEIKYWDSWEASSSRSLSFSAIRSPGRLAFDNVGNRLIVVDSSGSAYAISVQDKKKQLLASNLGDVSSIAVSQSHIVIAVGKKIILLARSDNHAENLPTSLQSLKAGRITGLAVDDTDKVWIVDLDRKVVTGSFLLN